MSITVPERHANALVGSEHQPGKAPVDALQQAMAAVSTQIC